MGVTPGCGRGKRAPRPLASAHSCATLSSAATAEPAVSVAREDLRRLSEYEDVAPGEISFMHDWNVFVRRFRPIGDREIPMALEAYAHWRGARMAEDPKWRRMFTMHCINQVDFGIVAPEHVDEALKIADQHRSARDKTRGNGKEGEAAPGEAVPGATDGA